MDQYEWLRARRRDWERSFDRARILEQSQPRSLVVVLGIGMVCILVPARVEPIASATQMRHVWLPVASYVAGVLASAAFWKVRGRGWLGLVLTFLDTGLLVTSVALCAALSQPPISYAYAALFGLMLASVQAREYALTLPFVLVCCVPPAVVSLVFGVDAMEILLLAIACIVALWLSYNTRQMQAVQRQRDRLVSALRASDEVADASVDLGLTGLLLNLGNFMHELRNAQSSVELNLHYLLESRSINGDRAEALLDAMNGHQRAMSLTRGVIDDLKSKGKTEQLPFRLDEVVRCNARALDGEVRIVVEEPFEPLYVRGDRVHIDEVLNNLVRNARQVGARTVTFSLRYEPAHTVVRLRVADDGPGLPLDRTGSLFKPFFSLSRSGGTGLGLYLCRRRLELMGGSIEASNATEGGAVFHIRLPIAHTSVEPNESENLEADADAAPE